jgi:dual specificity phosphatase 12
VSCARVVRDSLSFLLVEAIRMAGIPDAHEIVPGIWLGNKQAALNDKWLKEKNITVVFNASKDIPFSPRIQKQYRIPVDDNLQAEEIRNMTLWSHEAVYKVMKEHNEGNTILIHCFAGMQRSAAIVGMYLIAKKGMTWNQVIPYIQGIRPIAFRPQANFKDSLISFYKSYHEDILPKLSGVAL